MVLKYDWSNYIDITTFYIKVYYNTLTYTDLYKKKNSSYPQEMLTDIEEYLYYFLKNGYNIYKIVNKIDRFIHLALFESKNIFELVKKEGNVIYTNELIEGNDSLSAKERRRLYLYKELNKSIFDFKNFKTLEFSNLYSDLFPNKDNVAILVNDGWNLLQEVLSQELAERITYESLSKDRPKKTIGPDKNINIFPYDIINSKLDFYRPFSNVAILFGESISGVGTISNHSEEDIMNDLINKCIKENLSEQVISEYIYNDSELELYLILYLMGYLYETYNKIINNNLDKNKINYAHIHNAYNKLQELLTKKFTLDNDEYIEVPIKEVPKNNYIKAKIKNEISFN